MTEDEIKEMAQGGRPYSPQQNEQAKAKKEQPKEQPKTIVPEPSNNGEKLYKKCPTCGSFIEANGPTANLGATPNLGQGHPLNPYIRPFPEDTAKHPPREEMITSDEVTEDGKPLIEAKFKDVIGRIPNLPIRGE